MSEHSEQARFVAEVLYRYSNRQDFLRPLFFAVPNGMMLGGNPGRLMSKYKAEGLQNGIADILYLQPRGDFTCLAIEMKTIDRKKAKSGGMTEEQLIFQGFLLNSGGFAVTCFGADDAIKIFNDYMEMPVREYSELSRNPNPRITL